MEMDDLQRDYSTFAPSQQHRSKHDTSKLLGGQHVVLRGWVLGSRQCIARTKPKPGSVRRNLADLVGHRHCGRWPAASSLGCSTEPGQLEELARPCRVLVFSVEATEEARAGSSGALSPQLTACFTRALIRSSSAAVNSFSAKEVGHMAPSSRFASSLKPSVVYLDLNLCALWK